MFNISTTQDLIVYAVFPGQKIFLATYHPQISFNNVELRGIKTFGITITPTFTVHMPEKENCFIIGEGPDLIIKAHIEYEKW